MADIPALSPKKMAVPLLLAAVTAGLDQWSKLAVVRAFGLFEGKEIVAGVFNIVHVRNTGVAFSLFAGMDPRWTVPFLVGAGLLAVAGVVVYLAVLPARGTTQAALGLILGGAAGNLVDRARLGYVIDFLDLHFRRLHWPAFNVADIAISVGIGLLALEFLLDSRESRASAKPSA